MGFSFLLQIPGKKNDQPTWSPSTSEFLSRSSWDSSLGIKSSRAVPDICAAILILLKLRVRECRVALLPLYAYLIPAPAAGGVAEQIRTGVRGRAKAEP